MQRKHLLFIFFFPSLAHANVGVPLLMHWEHMQFFLLVPIILVEMCVYRKLLKLKWLKSVWHSLTANLASTFLGLIVAISISVPLYFVHIGGTWVTATMLLYFAFIYPFYRLSVWSEFWVIGRKVMHSELLYSVRIANRFSYSLIAITLLSSIAKSYIVNGYIVW